jgi:hypothetical protein
MTFTLTVAEDPDCSGLPTSDAAICTYDEGLGVNQDCWLLEYPWQFVLCQHVK